MRNLKKIINAALLVAGTTIGAGMLALPVVTAASGFIPSLVVFFVCYLFMLSTGLLLSEALCWFKGEFNLVTLSTRLLGKAGKWVSWILYLFLFYTLTVAYTAGGGEVFSTVLGFPKMVSEILFVLTFAFFVMKGAHAVHKINHYLMFGMFISYLGLIVFGIQKLDFALLKSADFNKLWVGLPVVFTSFSYQGIIPSLKTYLDDDIKSLKKAIFWGVSLPFFFYITWQAFVMGLIPRGVLEEMGASAIFQLETLMDSSWMDVVSKMFVFFAITTSFLGVTLGLKDFLKDGLGLGAKEKRFLLFLLTFLPPLIMAGLFFNAFILALRLAGGIGCALLLGLMPIIMVWKGRYILNHPITCFKLLKYKSVLVILALFVIFEVLLEGLHLFM